MAKVSKVAVAVVALASIKVAITGPRGGKLVKKFTPSSLVTFKNGNRRAVVPAGKRGGRMTVYCEAGKKIFAPRVKALAS